MYSINTLTDYIFTNALRNCIRSLNGSVVMIYEGQNDRERVLDATDLVALMGEHISLRSKGREHVGLCPFHDDHSPSLHVVTHKGTPFYKCFACGESGTALDFVIKYHKMPFIDALRLLADRAGIELTRTQRTENIDPDAPSRTDLISANSIAMDYFKSVLNHKEAGKIARDILEKRGISKEMIELFNIGAAPNNREALLNLATKRNYNIRAFKEAGLVKSQTAAASLRDTFINRLIFPICDQLGRPIAFGGRIIKSDDIPKYLNSPESPVFHKSRTLYGLNLASESIRKSNTAIVTEGYTDVIAMHQAGFTNSVATLGTALTPDHAKILQRLCDTVILLFDGDVAGQKAADRAVEIFFAQPIDVKICVLPEGSDPDEMLGNDGARHGASANGKEELQKLLDKSDDALAYLVRQFKTDLDTTDSISGKQKRTEALLARLADLGLGTMSGIRKRLILPALAQLLGVSIHDLERSIPRRRPRTSPTSQTPVQEMEVTEISSFMDNPVSKSRRTAERDLLGILLFNPEVRNESVLVDGHSLPIAEAYLPDSFADTSCRAIFEILYLYLEGDIEFNVATIQTRVEIEDLKKLVSDLYYRGSELCEDDENNAPDKLRDTSLAFDQTRDREMLRGRIDSIKQETATKAGSIANTLAKVLEERRLHGDDRTAFPRGIRSSAQ